MTEEKKPWQRGYEIEDLRKIAARFQEAYKPYVFGAFGSVKERDVADALAAGQLVRGGGGALAIGKRLRHASTHRDYAQRSIRIPAGTLLIQHIALRPGLSRDYAASSIQELVRLLEEKHPSAEACGAVLEIHQENVELVEAALLAGFRWAATKVSASSDLRALYQRPERAAGELMLTPPRSNPEDRATLGALEEAFAGAAELEAIRGLLEGLRPFAQHYSSYNWRQTWTAFALRGYSQEGDPMFIEKPAEMSKAWKASHPEALSWAPRWTDAWPHFQAAVEPLLEGIGAAGFERIRFMRVAGGGQLTRHADITDRDAGTKDGEIARLHIPIRTNPDVRFGAWEEDGRYREINMREGGLYYLDQRKPHRVRNGREGEERIHLVADCIVGPELRRMIASRIAS